MSKINIILVWIVSLSFVFSAGLKKPAASFDPVERMAKVESVNDNDQSLSLSIGCLTNSGELSDFDSAMAFDFLVRCGKSCSVLGQQLDLGFGVSLSPVNSDEDGISDLSLASMSLHVFPKLSLPISLDFGGGIGVSPNDDDLVGTFAVISMNMFYRLPFCENISLGLQYKNIIEPMDGEITFSRLSNIGLGLKIDG